MSAKTSTQPGRRTPLSLSGAVTKNNPIKSGNNPANGGGNNANGHTTPNTSRQDNKLQQQKNDTQVVNSLETKENPNKRQQLQADKKQQQNDNKKSNEKNQNGVSSNKQQQSTENKQQQQNKQPNGNDDNKLNEKDKKEKPEKSDKLDKQQDKSEKEDNKSKENKKVEQDKPDNKKEEKKSKEVRDDKDDKKEAATKTDAKTEQQPDKNDDKKSKEENQNKTPDLKPLAKVENMVVLEEQEMQPKSTPATPKANIKASKPSTPVNNTPTKVTEKTPQKSTPNNSVKTTSVIKREVTTTIDDDDVEMEPLTIESSPVKLPQPEQVTNVNIAPSATSTPGKIILPKRNSGVPKSDVQLAMQTGLSPERPRSFSQISGRKSIRQISDYTPSKFQSNLQFRESYRRINTELDATNTSMNVTVGSEVPNNLSFSFFGRGRKRDRTPPPYSQSAIGELKTDMEVSPPKRARLDIHGFFSVVSSPLALLRNRFSKASLQSSTPVKLQQKLNTAEDEIEVQNVSGVSVHEEIAKSDKEHDENNSTAKDNSEVTLGDEAKEKNLKTDVAEGMSVDSNSERKESIDLSFNSEKTYGIEQSCEQLDIKITETLLQPAVGDPMAKNKRCIVM